MRIKYMRTAFKNLISSKGWFLKTWLIALIGMIPLFGSIIGNGYIFSWSKDAAMRIYTPLPRHIFKGNPHLFKRGFFIFLLNAVLVCLIAVIWHMSTFVFSPPVTDMVLLALIFVGDMLFLTGAALIAAKDSFLAGFPPTLFRMIKKDTAGFFRIFGMYAILLLAILPLSSILSAIVGDVFYLINPAFMNDYKLVGWSAGELLLYLEKAPLSALLTFILYRLVDFLALTWLVIVLHTLVARALGHWISQDASIVFGQAMRQHHLVDASSVDFVPPVGIATPHIQDASHVNVDAGQLIDGTPLSKNNEHATENIPLTMHNEEQNTEDNPSQTR